MTAASLADRYEFCALRERQHNARYECVMKHDVGRFKELCCTQRQEISRAGTRADQIDNTTHRTSRAARSARRRNHGVRAFVSW